MKIRTMKLIGFAIILLGILVACCTDRSSSVYCGKRKIFTCDRYKDVLAKCGTPDESHFYQNDLGLQLKTRLTYHGKKLVIVTFQSEFLQNVKQASYEDSPIYLYFDRWGICTRIQEGDK